MQHGMRSRETYTASADEERAEVKRGLQAGSREAMVDPCTRKLLVLYGSQTGCAQEVAERIAWEGKRRHFRVRVAGMDEYDVMNLPSEPLVILCASTTGQGDVPDNMRAFWSFLLRRSLGSDSLVGSSFATFGLGDSGYAKYNAVAKRLDKRLEMLGAQRLVPLGLGDDQDRAGYDQALDPWLSALWDAALRLMPLPDGVTIDTSDSLPPARYLVTPAQSCATRDASALISTAQAGVAHAEHRDTCSGTVPSRFIRYCTPSRLT